jgi:hypothetical protein
MTEEKMERRIQEELRNRIDKKLENTRDQFAMAALAGMFSGVCISAIQSNANEFANTAYKMADAMMKRRQL